MALDEQLIKLKNYNIGFNIFEDTVVVNITYPKGWNIIPFENDDIKMFCEEGKYYYCISVDKDTNLIFEAIQNTIKYNQDLEKKVTLFNQKVNELKQLFIDEGYAELQTLEFSLRKKRGRKKKNEQINNSDSNSDTYIKAAEEDEIINSEIDTKVKNAIMSVENNKN